MFKTITALYVEDEEQIKNIVSSLFGNLFARIIVAADGKDGLDQFNQHKDEIDIIITDINMPKMNGLEMCEEIRKINTSVPIIITTAHNDKDFLHRAIKVGISDFVTKPMNMEVLLNSLKKNIEPILLQRKLDKQLEQHQEERLKTAKFSAIGQLAAGITHEINTPLTYIKASFEMMGYDIEDLPDSKTKDEIGKSISRIKDGLFRIENIVGSMKEMSQQSKIEKESSNIYSTVVTSAILAYNKIKHISNVYINDEHFSLDMDKESQTYMTDIQKQRIEQVWVIIINNAMDELMKIKDFNNRRLDINISSDETHINVIFKDNAGGIHDDIFDHLFEPFKGKKESSGMGVGLSIAKKIIADQGNASIDAYNEDNGAVFKIQFTI